MTCCEPDMEAPRGTCPSNGVTSAPRTDGFGAQYAAMASVYSWARRRRRPYCTSQWKAMEHPTGSTPPALFHFVGGPAYGPPASNSTLGFSEQHMPLAMLRNRTAAWHPDIRDFYHAAWPKPPLQWFAPGTFNLAVHVRRGDVRMTTGHDRFMSNGLVAQCILGALSSLPRAAGVHVFSQGERVDFGVLQKVPRVQFHLNAPLALTFHHLVHADALVMAASTLSDMAAFLAAGRPKAQIFASPAAHGLLHYMHDVDVRPRDCTRKRHTTRRVL